MLRVHPREITVRDAIREATKAFWDTTKKHELTTGEILRAISELTNDVIGTIARTAIRYERHGNAEKPGGEA